MQPFSIQGNTDTHFSNTELTKHVVLNGMDPVIMSEAINKWVKEHKNAVILSHKYQAYVGTHTTVFIYKRGYTPNHLQV